MKRKGYFHNRFWVVCGVLTIVLLARTPRVLADEKSDAERAQRAAAVMQEVMAAPDSGIPKDLLSKATAIAVVPHDVKGAFFVGGSFGKGLVSERKKDGSWSAPSYIDLSGGSFGLQFGVSSTDYVLVFTNYEGIKPLLKGKLKLGADASVAAGPVGRTVGADTNILLKSAIYTYSRSKGAFVGIALDGAVLTVDSDANELVYGKNVSADDLLVKQDVPANHVVMPFVDALDKYASHRLG